MAIRKQKLRHRIFGGMNFGAPATYAAPAGGNGPWPQAPAAAMGSGHPDPMGAMTAPVSVVTVAPWTQGYVTLGMSELVPLFTADGAAVPGTGPGQWDQLKAAGRP